MLTDVGTFIKCELADLSHGWCQWCPNCRLAVPSASLTMIRPAPDWGDILHLSRDNLFQLDSYVWKSRVRKLFWMFRKTLADNAETTPNLYCLWCQHCHFLSLLYFLNKLKAMSSSHKILKFGNRDHKYLKTYILKAGYAGYKYLPIFFIFRQFLGQGLG